ncbi:hypothetical protein ACJMK2_033268, partial [Sinanodonta woodiana]
EEEDLSSVESDRTLKRNYAELNFDECFWLKVENEYLAIDEITLQHVLQF